MLNILFYTLFGIYGLTVIAVIVMFIYAKLKGGALSVDCYDECETGECDRHKPANNEALTKTHEGFYEPVQPDKLK